MSFVFCEKCGKILLERMSNGLWRFKFGKRDGGHSVVSMEIHGSVKMHCTKRSCRHVNILNYFPSVEFEQTASCSNMNPFMEKFGDS